MGLCILRKSWSSHFWMWEKEKRLPLKFVGMEELEKDFSFWRRRRNTHSPEIRKTDLGQEGPLKGRTLSSCFECKDLAAGQQWGTCPLETAGELSWPRYWVSTASILVWILNRYLKGGALILISNQATQSCNGTSLKDKICCCFLKCY